MDILLINNFFSPEGGAERVLFEKYEGLKARGHRVRVFATNRHPFMDPQWDLASIAPTYYDAQQASALENLIHFPKLLYNPEAERCLTQLLKTDPPEVIHVDNLHFHLTPSVLVAAKRANIPVVMTIHDVRLACPAGTLMRGNTTYCAEELCVGKTPTPCIQHRCYRGSLANSVVVAAEMQFRQAFGFLNAVARFTTPSKALGQLMLRVGIPAERLMVLPNALPQSFLAPPPVPAPQRPAEPYLLFVGRLSSEKGLPLLLESMRQHPFPCPVHVVGTGIAKADYRAFVREHGLENQVVFRGFLTGDDLRAAYANAVAVVVCSAWFEIFGLSIIEAFAMEKPVVGTDIGAIPELVIPGETGLLFAPGDTAGLARQVQALWDNPEGAKAMGLRGRDMVLQRFHPDAILPSWEACYAELSQGVSR